MTIRPDILVWFLGYFVPAIVGTLGGKYLYERISPVYGIIFIHFILIFSASATLFMAQKYGLPLLSFLLDDFALLGAVWWMFCIVAFGKIGVLYGLSAFIQQMSMLAASCVLLPYFDLWAVIIMVSGIYIWAHGWGGWTWSKFVLVSAWAMLMMLVFSTYHALWLNALLHNIVGILGIYFGVLFVQPQWQVWLKARNITLPSYIDKYTQFH